MANQYRDFPIFQQRINDEAFLYLDNAATVPMPLPVQRVVEQFNNHDYANVHRGVYTLAHRATDAYEAVRTKVQRFLKAEHTKEIIFTSGTTASLNMVAFSFVQQFLQAGDEILLSPLEHHANLVVWQQLAQRKQLSIRYMPLLASGHIDVANVVLEAHTKLIAVSHVSNVLGVINDVGTLANKIHANNGVIVVDGAQAVPHMDIDVTPFDFYAFSGHKIGAPTGVGVLYGKYQWLTQMEPFFYGGGMIGIVDDFTSTWADIPWKFEAGTPNISGVIGLGAAIDYHQAHHATHALTAQIVTGLQQIDGIQVYGQPDIPVVSFNLHAIHPHDMASAYDMAGIALRAGHHCAQVLMRHLDVHATVRASFYTYHTTADVQRFLDVTHQVKEFFTNGII